MTRTCQGYPNHTCDVSLEGEHVLKKRCQSCRGKNDRMMQRLYGRSGRRTPRAKPLTREQSEWQGFTDAQRTARIVDGIRWGVSAGELAETYGITRAEVRSINCAHYQRRARIAA